ncbi:hypothetical protein NPIL_437191 [Nephila pilipes]|uniref:Uncharacterized protein n=1 Tax=Nephila pilipes TaxID=299642 RepID=A0A8X6Q2V6_NEPPI|nr:hypothetical protein NPIL_437191 [Nephila pilipes]
MSDRSFALRGRSPVKLEKVKDGGAEDLPRTKSLIWRGAGSTFFRRFSQVSMLWACHRVGKADDISAPLSVQMCRRHRDCEEKKIPFRRLRQELIPDN